MLNYKKTMAASQKYLNQDISTAHKTNYVDLSPSNMQLSTPKIKSVSKYGHKIRGVRNDIQQIIGQVGGKRDLNFDAIQRVRNINADAVGTLRDGFSTPKGNTKYPKKQFNNYDGFPAQDPNFAQNSLSNLTNGYDAYGKPTPINSKLTNIQSNIQSMNLYEQNIQLQRSINEQIKQNNSFLKTVKYLQNQNDQLRTQLGLPLSNYKYNFNPDNTNINNNFNGSRIAYETEGNIGDNKNRDYQNYNINLQQDLGIYSNPNIKTYSQLNAYGNSYQNYNRNLDSHMMNYKTNLNYVSNQNSKAAKFGDTYPQTPVNSNKNSYQNYKQNTLYRNNPSPYQMWRELQQLKDQDQILRQKTLSILKS